MTPAIKLSGLHKRYGEIHALDGLDLAVEPGTVFGFLGPNGAGKTTTIRILAGLARATEGQAWVDGMDIAVQRDAISRRIGYLPEEPAFYNWMTPKEFLAYVGRVFGQPHGESDRRAAQLLETFGLAEAASRRIGGFSRGMRQRLGLAQAMMNRPAILFLDEPVSALDPAGRKEVLEMIEHLRGECTVFMSSHILADVERVCDTIGIIARGRLVLQSPREALLEKYALPVFELTIAEETASRVESWLDSLKSQPWVRSVSREGTTIRIDVRDVPAANRTLLPSAIQSGLIVTRFELMRASLEDIFLRQVEPEKVSQ